MQINPDNDEVKVDIDGLKNDVQEYTNVSKEIAELNQKIAPLRKKKTQYEKKIMGFCIDNKFGSLALNNGFLNLHETVSMENMTKQFLMKNFIEYFKNESAADDLMQFLLNKREKQYKYAFKFEKKDP